MDSLTIKLPTHLKDAIAKLAAADGRSVSDFVRRHFSSTLPVQTTSKQKGKA